MRQQKRFYVKYFNGFSLHNEEVLFEEYLNTDENCVAGFSYGAQRAFEYVYQTEARVDKLILLSPAFFQTQTVAFIHAQLHYFETQKQTYMKQFLKNVSYPSSFTLSPFLSEGNIEELKSLLTYRWEKEKLLDVLQRGTCIEVFLGEKDKIIDAQKAADFFTMTSTYIFKNTGHLLKEKQ